MNFSRQYVWNAVNYGAEKRFQDRRQVILEANRRKEIWRARSSAAEQWTHNPLVVGSNPTGPIQQNFNNKGLTKSKQTNELHNSENLVQILFSDPQLQQFVGQWLTLSVELRKAIIRMVT
jgi:hypothetical protein